MRSARLSRLIMAILGFALLFTASTALADAALNVETSTAADGSITATVSLDGNMTASGVQFALSYDDSKLTLTGAQDGLLDGSYTVNDSESGSVRVVWYNIDGQAVNGNANLLTLNFTPKANGETRIGFDESMSAMVVDSQLNNISTTVNPATLTVNRAPGSAIDAANDPNTSVFNIATPTPAPYLATLTPTPQPTPTTGVAVTEPPAKGEATKAPAPAADDAAPSAGETLEDYDAPVLAASAETSASPVTAAPVSAPETDGKAQIEIMAQKENPAAGKTTTALIICACVAVCAGGALLWRRNKK